MSFVKKAEKRDRPDSVFDCHSSRIQVALDLKHPTRLLKLAACKTQAYLGLHRIEFTGFHYSEGFHLPYILSVALVLISRRAGVTRYAAIRCPDLPPARLLSMPATISSSRQFLLIPFLVQFYKLKDIAALPTTM